MFFLLGVLLYFGTVLGAMLIIDLLGWYAVVPFAILLGCSCLPLPARVRSFSVMLWSMIADVPLIGIVSNDAHMPLGMNQMISWGFPEWLSAIVAMGISMPVVAVTCMLFLIPLVAAFFVVVGSDA